jgi:hypothetical protein
MTEDGLDAVSGNPKYKKAHRWSLKKLENALDVEAQGVAITRSTIGKLEANIENLLEKCSSLIGETVSRERLPEFVERIQDKVVLLELKTHEGEVKLLMNQLTSARMRLQDHSHSKSMLLELIKRKNQ